MRNFVAGGLAAALAVVLAAVPAWAADAPKVVTVAQGLVNPWSLAFNPKHLIQIKKLERQLKKSHPAEARPALEPRTV